MYIIYISIYIHIDNYIYVLYILYIHIVYILHTYWWPYANSSNFRRVVDPFDEVQLFGTHDGGSFSDLSIKETSHTVIMTILMVPINII